MAASLAGCTFPGRPLVEATGSLREFHRPGQERQLLPAGGLPSGGGGSCPAGAFLSPPPAAAAKAPGTPCLKPLHLQHAGAVEPCAGTAGTSVRCHGDWAAQRHPEDCAGCPLHHLPPLRRAGSCFYGGVMVQEVYPAIRDADAVVLLCPQLQRRPLRQPHRCRQPSDGPVPHHLLCGKGGVRHRGLRLLRRGTSWQVRWSPR